MSEFITPEVNIPQRNLSKELDTIFASQKKFAPGYYDLESKYGPLYNRIGLRNVGEQTLGFDEGGQHVPGTLELSRAASEYQRGGDISDLETLGPRAVDADLAANPWLRRSLNLVASRENDTPLLQKLNYQANEDLNSGGYLSPEAERSNREATRAAWQDRGLGFTDQAAIDELMNREALRSGRVAASRKFAGDVEGLNQVMRDYIGRSTQIDATALPDVSQLVLSRPSTPGAMSTTPIGSGTKLFDPFNPYFQDYFSSNQNAAATEAIGNAQAQAATRAAIASIAGSAIKSDIRLKENIRELPNAELRLPNRESVPRYSFTYRAGCVPKGLRGDRAYIGVMADDVEKVFPEAVSTDPRTGFKQVNYTMLGIELEEAA